MKSNTLSCHVAADADVAFAAITDVDHLPDWNRAIVQVLERPTGWDLGTEWVVEVTALGQHWPSRSRLEEYEPGRRFAYRSGTDDGNPSYAKWSWTITPAADGCEVAVTWSVNPKTFWRRLLFAHVRSRQLRQAEVPASLRSLQALAEKTKPRVD